MSPIVIGGFAAIDAALAAQAAYAVRDYQRRARHRAGRDRRAHDAKPRVPDERARR